MVYYCRGIVRIANVRITIHSMLTRTLTALSCTRLFLAGVFSLQLQLILGVQLASAQDGARDAALMDGIQVPEWRLNELEIPDDTFAFARLRYLDGGKWNSDYPESDINLSFRLQQLTSLDVNPDPPLLELTDEALFDHPFIFMVNPHHGGRSTSRGGAFDFSQDEGAKLRDYLLNGGFLWVDDFWSRGMWEHFQDVIGEKVFPDRQPKELAYEHPIFHNIFELDKIPQVPSHDAWDFTPDEGTANKTYEWKMDPDDQEYLSVPRFMAYYDDDGRMCMLVNVNNDIADGWEEEGYKPWFFNAFSEKYCFPLAINVLFYVMTH
ncbi:MAG: hypothetical protein ACI9R3_003860 [Verrucomicrobiales bacterium]|jgi:hypothetical protein